MKNILGLHLNILFLILVLIVLSSCAGKYSYLLSIQAPQGTINIPIRSDEYIGLDNVGDTMNAEVQLINIQKEE